MINWHDILDDIISSLEPEHVPVEYVIMAKLVDKSGIERILKGNELKVFLKSPEKYQSYNARIIVDVRKIKMAMATEVVRFFEGLNQ